MNPISFLSSVVLSVWSVLGPLLCTAQWTTGPKAPCADRLYFKLYADTMLVKKNLREIQRKGKAYGAIHAMGYWAARSGIYPRGRPMRPLKRLTTTDTAYRKGSTHLLSGAYRVHWRNGHLRRHSHVI